jgi:hypothetical protein
LLNRNTQSLDHVRRALAIAKGSSNCFRTRRPRSEDRIQHPEAGARVVDDARERLVDLMRDRGGQCIQRRRSRYVGKLRAGPVQGLLGDPARRYVLECADEQGTTRNLLQDTGHATHVLDGASSGHNPETKGDVRTRHCVRDHGVE